MVNENRKFNAMIGTSRLVFDSDTYQVPNSDSNMEGGRGITKKNPHLSRSRARYRSVEYMPIIALLIVVQHVGRRKRVVYVRETVHANCAAVGEIATENRLFCFYRLIVESRRKKWRVGYNWGRGSKCKWHNRD